jgi:hypothetical protein
MCHEIHRVLGVKIMYIPIEAVTFIAGFLLGAAAMFGGMWYLTKKVNEGGDKV